MDPDLGEAHLALGLWFLRRSDDFGKAHEHLEQVQTRQDSAVAMQTVLAWDTQALFQLGLYDKAFDAIRAVSEDADVESWEWPWCASLVRTFGMRNTSAATKALKFWRRFLKAFPGDLVARAQEFECACFLHEEAHQNGLNFQQAKQIGEELMVSPNANRALIWDRLGHWAQTDRDWVEAEKAFRQAVHLAPDRYACCLGCALNALKRWQEALDVLLQDGRAHAEVCQWWFQVAIAREHLGDIAGAVEGYSRAIELKPDYEVAHFNLGGVFWNAGRKELAVAVWTNAVQLFPSHPLVQKLPRFMQGK